VPSSKYCPFCDRPYPTWDDLITHLKKAASEGDKNHIELIELEDWPTTVPTNLRDVPDDADDLI